MNRLQDKVAVITGAGSGMGREMALLFAREGARVVCADRSGAEQQTAGTIGERALAVHCDVAIGAEVRNMIDTAVTHFGRLDVLVNNAGFGGPMKPLHEQAEDDYDTIQAVNLKGVFLGMKYGIAAMLKSGGGAVVNTASAAGLVGMKHHSIYGAAKAGVVQLTKAAALDYAQQNIRINAICPGMTWTGLVKASIEHPVPPADAKPPFGVPMDRWGLASELANAALFLASDEASYITGVALPVDGGYVV